MKFQDYHTNYAQIIQRSVFLLIIILSTGTSNGQEKKPIFLGLQPGITKESFYEEDEFDINILPIVFQMPLGKRIDIRFTSVVNYHSGPERGVSDVGLNTVLPVFFLKKEYTNSLSKGFYIGPVIGLGQNLIDDHFTVTTGLEPGYMFPANKSFTLSLGIQLGGSYFIFPNEQNSWHSHFGPKVNLGFWINQGNK